MGRKGRGERREGVSLRVDEKGGLRRE